MLKQGFVQVYYGQYVGYNQGSTQEAITPILKEIHRARLELELVYPPRARKAVSWPSGSGLTHLLSGRRQRAAALHTGLERQGRVAVA